MSWQYASRPLSLAILFSCLPFPFCLLHAPCCLVISHSGNYTTKESLDGLTSSDQTNPPLVSIFFALALPINIGEIYAFRMVFSYSLDHLTIYCTVLLLASCFFRTCGAYCTCHNSSSSSSELNLEIYWYSTWSTAEMCLVLETHITACAPAFCISWNFQILFKDCPMYSTL